MAANGNGDRRWRWWGQTRDALCATAGFVLLGFETWRGTYNVTAMAAMLALLGVAGAGTAGRALLGRWEREDRR